MSPLLAKCISLRPDLFWWSGLTESDQLEKWLNERPYVPSELADLWRQTGGGTIFETEEVLSPLGPTKAAAGVEERTVWHRTRGLPESHLLFHEGAVLSAVHTTDGVIVVLGHNYSVHSMFKTFSEWFRSTLLNEYEDRYGLSGAV